MYQNYNDISYAESPFGTLNQYMTKTFGWMFAGLLVTFAVAIGAISTGLVYAFINSGVFFITCIAELILVGVLSARVTSLQPGTATGIFFAYAALNGLNLCSIFLIYDLGSLVLAFLVGAVYFGVMAVYGATTNRSLVGWGPKLMGGLIAMIICSLVGSLFSLKWYVAILMVVGMLAIVMFIVFISNSERRIPVQYAKRVVGRKMYGGQSTNLPIKVNMSGVLPIIFAQSIATLPATIMAFVGAPASGFWAWMNTYVFDTKSAVYIIVYFFLIIAFSYFYATIQFNPIEIANNLKKNGASAHHRWHHHQGHHPLHRRYFRHHRSRCCA